MIAGDFNVEPTKIPCLLKGISAGLWLICKVLGLGLLGLSRIIPVSGTRLALGELGGTLFFAVPWLLLHLGAAGLLSLDSASSPGSPSFVAGGWSAKVTQPVTFSPLWPASWVSAVDKSRKTKSAEVTEVWEVYDHGLQFVPIADALTVGDALAGGDVHLA